MGLDILAAKKADGTDAYETLGVPKLDPANPEHVAHYRAIYDAHNENITAQGREDGYATYWTRPFEEVLADDAGIYLPDLMKLSNTPPNVQGFVSGSMTGPYTSFRGKMVQYTGGVPEDLVNALFNDHEPEDALVLADRLDGIADSTDNPKVVQQCAQWIRFWASRGHPIIAWY